MRRSPTHRFFVHVEKTADGCWLWTASKYLNGYGQFSVAGKKVLAHRFSYELLVGPIPDGLEIDHLCRVRHCVNPEHLEAVTRSVNLRRGATIVALRAAQTHCMHGHEFTSANTYRWRGHRACRTCARERKRAAA